MNSEAKGTKRFTCRNEAAAFAVSLLFSLTVFFFSPAELYCRNPLDYLLGDREILLPMLLLSIAVTAGLMLFLNLVLLLHEKLFHVLLCILFGFTLAGYVQMTFYNQRIHTLDGSFSSVYPADLYGYVNFFVFFILLVLPPLVYAGVLSAKKQPKIQALSLLCLVLFAMQSAGFLSVYLVKIKSFGSENKHRIKYVSYDPLLSLSKEKNIIVFLMDTMDGYWTDAALELYPELNEMLDGFTYYQNNISVFPHTFPSVPEMLSGIPFQGESSFDYLDRVWSGRNLPQLLHEKEYTVNMVLDGSTCYQSCEQISRDVDNIREMDPPAYNYLGRNGIVGAQIRLSLMRMLPYLFKELPSGTLGSQFANDFIIMNSLPDDYHKEVSSKSDFNFYMYFQSHGIRTDSEKPVFDFCHLNGPHDHDFDFELNENYPLPESDKYTHKESMRIRTIRAEMDVIAAVLAQMKECGIYDQSTILILGDHGRSPKDSTDDYEHGLTGEILTALMIKPENAPHGKLKTDPDSALSNAFFTASILEYAGIEHSDFGLSYQDVISQHLIPERRWVLQQFTGFFSDPVLYGEYTIGGNARDFGNWRKTG